MQCRSIWALCARSDRVKLFLLSGGQGPSVSTSALNRAHRNPHHHPPHPSLTRAEALSLSSSPGPNKPGSSLSFSLFHLSISWHAVTPLIGIINQTGQIRLQIKINYPEHPPLRHLHFCSKASLLTGLLPPHLLNKSKMSTAGSRLKTWTLWQTVGVHYCFIDINNSPYLQRWWLLRTNLPSM